MISIFRGHLSLLLCLCFSLANAQTATPYTFLEDDTIVRQKFYDQSQLKKAELIEAAGKENAKEYKALYNEVFTDIGSLWKSSRVITETKTQAYLAQIVNRIVAVNPVLKSLDYKIVFTRDWWPNAACMTDGTIVFNAGLLIYLENEAEIAFVLSHELAHYYLQHSKQSIKKYIETVTSKDFQSELKRLSKQEYGANKELEALGKTIAFNSRKHSRDKESEADRYAFSFLKQTGYDLHAITNCLQLLDKIDDSLLYKPTPLSQSFSFTDYAFKPKWTQKESSIFSEMDKKNSGLTAKEIDSLKTHPDCLKRIDMLKDSMSHASAGASFLADENMFRQLKNDFFAEITEQCYQQESLSRNLYYSLLLLQDEHKKTLGIYSVARCLNQIYEVQKVHKLGNKIDTEDATYSSEYNELLRFLGRVRLEELANINYYFCKKYEPVMTGYPGFDKEILKASIAKNNYQ